MFTQLLSGRRTVLRIGVVLALVGSSFLTLTSSLSAANEGSLDSSFGNGGIAQSDFSFQEDGWKVAIQSDGKIVVAVIVEGDGQLLFGAVRYNTNGTLDTSFGDGGISTVDIQSIDAVARSVAIQPDGKILLGGYTFPPFDDSDFVIARLTASGQPDNSFGNNGSTITQVTNNDDFSGSMILTDSGKIVLSGGSFNGDNTDAALVRYNTNGTLDTSFGNEGIVITDLNGSWNRIIDSAVQPDGKIVSAGYSRPGDHNVMVVYRHHPNGELDFTFGTNGIVELDVTPGTESEASSLSLHTDGKIVIVGKSGSGSETVAVATRLLVNGSTDRSFGTTGVVLTDFGGGSSFVSSAIQQDGKLVVAGGPTGDFIDEDPSGIIAFARFNTDGSLDSTFGSNGKAVFIERLFLSPILHLALQPDGKIVAVGRGGINRNRNVVVLRLNASFVPPTTNTTTTPVAIAPAPASARYSTGNKKVTVRWSAVDGASSYVVVNAKGVSQCISTTTSCQVSGLRNGKIYSLFVRSINSDGVQSPTGTEVRVIPGFTLKKTSFAVKKSASLASIVTTPSKGKKTWRVTSGACRLRGSTIVAPTKPGSCKLRLNTAKRGAYPAMSTTITLTVR